MVTAKINNTVLVGMTGTMESMVAAYLLKKQGFNCIGIGISFSTENKQEHLLSPYLSADLEKAKKACDYLDIPFYAVDAYAEYTHFIIDPFLAKILSGQIFDLETHVTRLIFDILLEKKAFFKAHKIATAHYSKVLKNQKNGDYELYVSNDLSIDQSFLLSRLEQKHLEHLILPLADLRKAEVEKIGSLFNISLNQDMKKKYKSFLESPHLVSLLEEKSAPMLRKPGSVFDYATSNLVGEHHGIHHFYVGKKQIGLVDKKAELTLDSNKRVVHIVPKTGAVYIDDPTHYFFKHVFLTSFIQSPANDMTVPQKCFYQRTNDKRMVPCKLYFKNNGHVMAELEAIEDGVIARGEVLTFYSKNSEKARIVGSALVDRSGLIANRGFIQFPKKELEDTYEDAISQTKKNTTLSF